MTLSTKIPVFSLALVLGEKNKSGRLLYTHAPVHDLPAVNGMSCVRAGATGEA